MSAQLTHQRGDDPRWDILKSVNGACACCGTPTSTLLSFAFSGPDVFQNHENQQENWTLLQDDGDVLTEDFCRMDKYRFVRCTLEIPLKGLDAPMTIGVWGTLSIENFERFVDTFDAGTQAELGEMFSWLSNAVPPSQTGPAAMTMVPRNDRQRPQLFFADKDHPLYEAQKEGLPFEAFASLLKGFGHDVLAKTHLN